MRIAYLTQSYPPMISGAAISAQQTAESMARRGHQVLVVAASDREYAYNTYEDNLTVLRLSSFNNPMRVGQRLTVYPRLKMIKFLKRFQPDVIHAHEPLHMGMLALAYANHAKIPVAITAHQLPWFVASYLPELFKPSVEKILWTFERITLKKYTSIIAPTQTIAKIIEKKTGIVSNVISYGIDLGTFNSSLSPEDGIATRTKLKIPANIPTILHVGRLDTDKRVDRVIRASAQVLHKTEAFLLIVGDGCEKYNLIRLCKNLGIESRVCFTGYISPQNGLPDVYRLASVFVTASEIETQGIVLHEAAASGLPIVAVNATCIPEIVHDQINGFLVNSGDINAFSDAITRLLNDTKRAHAMGKEGRIIAEEHDIHNTWELHENLYLEMTMHTHARHINERRKTPHRWASIKELMGLR